MCSAARRRASTTFTSDEFVEYLARESEIRRDVHMHTSSWHERGPIVLFAI